MVRPELAVVLILVAAAVICVGFVLGIPPLYFLGMIALPLAVLSGVPIWGGKTQGGGYRH